MSIEEFGGDFIQWLRGFHAVSQVGSVSAAARLIHRNQPTVSQQIKRLESTLGVVLFKRSRTRMELTAEGQFLLEKTLVIFDAIKELKAEVVRQDKDLSGVVTVATTHAVILYYLPRHVVSFGEEYPEVHFELIGGGLGEILSLVESGKADFGLASLMQAPKGLVFEPLFKTELKVISPMDNRFQLGNPPSLEQIARTPFIAFPETSTIQQSLDLIFMRQGLRLNIIQVLNNFEIVKKYVALGMGIAILDDFALTEKNDDLLTLSLSGDNPNRDYGLILRQQKYLTKQARAFMTRIKSEIAHSPSHLPPSREERANSSDGSAKRKKRQPKARGSNDRSKL